MAALRRAPEVGFGLAEAVLAKVCLALRTQRIEQLRAAGGLGSLSWHAAIAICWTLLPRPHVISIRERSSAVIAACRWLRRGRRRVAIRHRVGTRRKKRACVVWQRAARGC